MIEQMKRAALLSVVSALFASGAWGQATPNWQQDSWRLNFAAEYFGDPREVLNSTGLRGNLAMRTRLKTVDFNNARYVAKGNVVLLTYRLMGATFASSISTAGLTITRKASQTGGSNAGGSPEELLDVAVSPGGGGAVGDNYVTYRLTVGDDCIIGKSVTGLTLGDLASGIPDTFDPCDGSAPANNSNGWSTDSGASVKLEDFILFNLPNLMVDPVALLAPEGADRRMPPTTGVAVVVSFESVESVGAGGMTFPTTIAGLYDHDGRPDTPGKVDLGHPGGGDALILRSTPVLTVSLADGTDAEVDIRAREVLDDDGGSVAMKVDEEDVRALKVATLMIDATAPDATAGYESVYQLRTHTQPTTSTGVQASLGGNVDVTVVGPFREGDAVYLGTTKMTMNDNGDFMGSTSIANTADGGVAVNYVPNGTVDLRPGDFSATAALKFNEAKNASGAIPLSRTPGEADGMGMASIAYQSIGPMAYAYGVVRAGGMETSFLRVGCVTSAAGCAVFLDCTDQAGAAYFGELMGIPRGATMVYDSDAIASSFPNGGWERGRGSCQLLSNGALEVQHNVRSGSIQTSQNIVIGNNTGSVGVLGK